MALTIGEALEEADRLAAWEAGQDAFYADKSCTPSSEETYPDAWRDGWNDARTEHLAEVEAEEWIRINMRSTM